MELIEVAGGVCAPRGVQASGIHAGIYEDSERLDLAISYLSQKCLDSYSLHGFCSSSSISIPTLLFFFTVSPSLPNNYQNPIHVDFTML